MSRRTIRKTPRHQLVNRIASSLHQFEATENGNENSSQFYNQFLTELEPFQPEVALRDDPTRHGGHEEDDGDEEEGGENDGDEIEGDDDDDDDDEDDEDLDDEEIGQLKHKNFTRDEWLYALAYLVVYHNVTRKLLRLLIDLLCLRENFKITKNAVYSKIKLFQTPFNIQTSKVCPLCINEPCDHPKSATLTTADILTQLETIYRNNLDVLDSLELTINTDGVVPKNHKGLSFWPLFITVQTLPTHRRGLRKNCVFAGLLSGVSNPSTELLEEAQRHLLNSLPSNVLETWVDGKRHSVPIVLKHGSFDTPAYQKCYGLSAFSSKKKSCRACLATPSYIDCAYRYDLFANAELRTPLLIQEGLSKITVMHQLLPITSIRTDFLHVLDEGLITYLLKLMYNYDGSKKTKVSLGPFGSRILREYSRCGGRIASSENKHEKRLGLLSGHERRFVFCDTMACALPFLWRLRPQAHEEIGLIYAVWIIVRILATSTDETELEAVASLIEVIGRPFQEAFGPRAQTMKHHLFFAHSAGEIREHGSFMQFSAATFESYNGDIQKYVHPANAKSFHLQLINRHLVHVSMANFLANRTNSPDFEQFWSSIEEKSHPFTNFPKCKLSQIDGFIQEAKVLWDAVEGCTVASRFRLGSDQVRVTESAFYLRVVQNGQSAIVRPLFGFIVDEKQYVYVERVYVSNPFEMIETAFPYLASITAYQRFIYVLDTDNSTNFAPQRDIIEWSDVKSYLFSFTNGFCFLVDGYENVSRL